MSINFQDDMAYMRQVSESYKTSVEALSKYLPWLESKRGTAASRNYSENGVSEHTVAFPVYDSNLMAFIKEVHKWELTDRNYVYVYSRNRVKTAEDELKLIASADLKDMDILIAVLSKYVLGGQTKGTLWTEGVTNGVLFAVVDKMKKNVEFWDKPL